MFQIDAEIQRPHDLDAEIESVTVNLVETTDHRELPIIETDPPEYDPETQWIENFGRVADDHIEQYWVIHEINPT